MKLARRLAFAAALVLLGSGEVSAQTGANVLVVVNAASADSVRIAEYYAGKRAVPAEQVLKLEGLEADPPDGIDRPQFERLIQAPIARWLARNQAQDRILFIVLIKGIPLRINEGNLSRSAASVDSELTLLYRRMAGETVPLAGPIPNPYFLGDRPIAEAARFTREAQSIYLVTRLDGYTVDDVIGLVDRGAAPESTGRFVLDGKASWTDKGNEWLREAADRLKAAGLPDDRVVFDASATVLTDLDDVLGYYSWGSNDPAIRRRTFGLSFRPGAIGGMFVSTDGRTFREPPAEWVVGNWNDRSKWHAGSPQSLAGDLIREGITGVAGHVSEPLLGHTIRPNVLFPAYFSGFSLAEAFYLAMPSLGWMTVVVGDPLCAPFGAKMTTSAGEPPSIDPATELPRAFSERRLAALAATYPKVPAEALRHFARAVSRSARGDTAGFRAGLEQTVQLAPGFVAAQHALAGLYEAAGESQRAMAVYRAVLKAAPNEALALNNLAYALAVREGNLAEALPLAERARKLAPRSGAVADTLGWIHFMRGDLGRAGPLLAEAVRLSPENAEVRLHLAQALVASGDVEAGRKELAKALERAPELRERAEVKRLLEER